MRDMKRECEAVVENFSDEVLWYLSEFRENKDEWAEAMKTAFCEMVDSYNDFEEDE